MASAFLGERRHGMKLFLQSVNDTAAARLGWGMAGFLLVAQGMAIAAQLADSSHVLIACLLFEGAIYAAAAWMISTGRMTLSAGAVLAVAALLRISVLGFEPYFSSDIFRYIWDGRVQGAGINPYLYIPDDAALSALRDNTIWPNINRANYAHTIYPPAAEALYFLATRVSETVVWMKAVLVLFEVGAIAVLLRLLDIENLPRQRILLYAWSPLPVWEFAGGGHIDAAMMAFAVVALLARRRGADLAAGAALGLAILVKFFPLVFLPALWRRWQWRLPAACAAIIVVFYLFYISAGIKVFGFLPAYVGEEGIGDAHGFWFVSIIARTTGFVIPAVVYFAVAAVVMIAVALRTQVGPTEPGRLYADCLALAGSAMFVLTPVYPWYFCWLVPFLCFVPSLPIIWICSTAFLFYWDSARDVRWMTDVVYGGAIVAVAVDIARRHWFRQPIGSVA